MSNLDAKVTYHHADVVTSSVLAFFNRLVQNQVHKRVKTSKHAGHRSPGVYLDRELLVHKPKDINILETFHQGTVVIMCNLIVLQENQYCRYRLSMYGAAPDVN